MRSPAAPTSPRALDGPENTYWEEEFSNLLPELRKRLWTTSTSTVCPLLDLGDYVLQEFQLITYFMDSMAEDTMDKHRKFCMPRLTECDDGTVTKYLMARETALREIRHQLISTADKCREIWKAVPPPSSTKPASQFVPINAPFSPQRVPSYPISGPDYNTGVAIRVRAPEAPEPLDDMEDDPSPGGDHADDDFDIMEEGDQPDTWKKPRGKSDANICPYGRKCNMKGYDPVTGDMKVFLLNSAFNDHMRKHAKPFVCTKCGSRFARKAALQRHQSTPLHQSGGQPHTVKFVQANKDYSI